MKTNFSIEMIKSDNYKQTKLCPYQCLIGKLMYLAYDTRPDIAFAIRQLSKYNSNPKKGHLQAAKRVVRYLKRTMQLRLVYAQKPDKAALKDLSPYSLIGYADGNFTDDPEDRKSVKKHYFFFNKAIVSWNSKKQETVSTSTPKTEYIAFGYTVRKII